MFNFFQKKPDYTKQLAVILSQLGNKESLLGVKDVIMPSPKDIRDNAARLERYSQSSDYKAYADEVWARVLNHLDIILNDKSTDQMKSYHCGALKESLDLLRLSYQARSVRETCDEEQRTSSRS